VITLRGNHMPASDSWGSKCAALKTAFRRLAIQRGEEGIPYEFLIPGIAKTLLLMVPNAAQKKALPPRKALHSLTRLLTQTHDVLERLPPPVLDALNYRPEALFKLKRDLKILLAAAKTAEVKTRRSPPRKLQEQKIAQIVAQHYFALTGKKPTVSVSLRNGDPSPFVKLLTDVYRILGVKVSAASQAKMVADRWPSIAATFSRI
jgi:hypothetical protein